MIRLFCCALVCMLVVAPPAWTAPPTVPLSTIFLDLDDASLAEVRRVAELQALQQFQMDKGPRYKSTPPVINRDPKKLSDELVFEGLFTTSSPTCQLALFSDDGCDVWIDNRQILSNFKKGQHLPNLKESLHVLNYQPKPGVTYLIRIHYGNTIYTGTTDIDGCTLFAFAGGGAMIEIDFLDNQNKVLDDKKDAIKPSCFITHEPGKELKDRTFDLKSVDPDNFRIQIDDPAAKAASVEAVLSIKSVDGKIKQQISYHLKLKSGAKFRSPIMRLVSDLVDDMQPKQFSATTGDFVFDTDNQTILAVLEDTLTINYKGQTKTIMVGRPAKEDGIKAIRTVDIELHIAKGPGFEERKKAAVKDFEGANERWAQCCIRFKLMNMKMFDMPNGSLNIAGEFIFSDAAAGNPLRMSPAALAIVKTISPKAALPIVSVYYTPPLFDPAPQERKARAVSFYPGVFKLAADRTKVVKINSTEAEDPKNAHVIFIGKSAGSNHTLAHELGHILVNTNDPAPLNPESSSILFPDNLSAEESLVSGPKRLPTSLPGSIPTVPSHTHFTGVELVNGVAEAVPIKPQFVNFNVCKFARTMHSDKSTIVDLGNKVIQRK